MIKEFGMATRYDANTLKGTAKTLHFTDEDKLIIGSELLEYDCAPRWETLESDNSGVKEELVPEKCYRYDHLRPALKPEDFLGMVGLYLDYTIMPFDYIARIYPYSQETQSYPVTVENTTYNNDINVSHLRIKYSYLNSIANIIGGLMFCIRPPFATPKNSPSDLVSLDRVSVSGQTEITTLSGINRFDAITPKGLVNTYYTSALDYDMLPGEIADKSMSDLVVKDGDEGGMLAIILATSLWNPVYNTSDNILINTSITFGYPERPSTTSEWRFMLEFWD